MRSCRRDPQRLTQPSPTVHERLVLLWARDRLFLSRVLQTPAAKYNGIGRFAGAGVNTFNTDINLFIGWVGAPTTSAPCSDFLTQSLTSSTELLPVREGCGISRRPEFEHFDFRRVFSHGILGQDANIPPGKQFFQANSDFVGFFISNFRVGCVCRVQCRRHIPYFRRYGMYGIALISTLPDSPATLHIIGTLSKISYTSELRNINTWGKI